MLGTLARFTPVGRATAALWAWRNRRELGRWLGFAWRAVPPSAARRQDLVTEARLRTALSREERTRGVPSLVVRVRNGAASLTGHLSPDLHDLVYSIAERTRGIERVDCRISDRGASPSAMPHAHTDLGRSGRAGRRRSRG